MLAIIKDNQWIHMRQVVGDVESLLVDHFSVKHKRAQFIDVEQQHWDGWYRKYDQSKQRLALPLLQELKEFAVKHNIPLEIQDLREAPPIKPDLSVIKPDMLGGITLQEHQIRAIQAACEHPIGLISAVTGAGKCLGKGTPVMMYDGSIKPVEEVVVGDLLMGDDSTPRSVLSTCQGREELYRVHQKNGDPYVVNKSHILSVKVTPKYKGEAHQKLDISVTDYLRTNSGFKHRVKGYKVPVQYPVKTVPFDPYLLGLWLGDGVATDLQFSVGERDIEIVEYLQNYATSIGQVLVKYPDEREAADIYAIRLYAGVKAPRDYIPLTENPLRREFKQLGLLDNKHVPEIFKFNDREIRLKLLAGFIDADGDVHPRKDYVAITHRPGRLINDIASIARSLGFRVRVTNKYRKCTTTGKGAIYTNVGISGNVSLIPCLLPRKRADARRITKDPLVCGIWLESLGVGPYYGFQIDGNRRFLLGDFTVTHNTEIMAGIVKVYNCPTVILADQRVVIEQIKQRLELRDIVDEVGLFYGGETPSGQMVVVGSIASLTSPPSSLAQKDFKRYKKRKQNAENFQEIVRNAGLLLVDEADKATDKRYRRLFKNYFQGRYKFGFSGTCFDPEKPVEALVLKENLGSIIIDIGRRELEEAGRIIPIKAYMIAVGADGDKYDRTIYDVAEKECMIDNQEFHRTVKQIVDGFPNDRTLILVDTNNVELLGVALEKTIPGSKFIYGKTSKTVRQRAIKEFEDGECKVLIGGRILKRGLDLKGGVDNLIVCGNGKLTSDFDQKVGRAVRQNSKGWARLFFFLHLNNYYLYKHSKIQLQNVLRLGYGTQVIVNGKQIDGQKFVSSKFKIPK